MQEGGMWSLANLRIPVIAVCFAAVLGLAIGAQALYYRTQVESPMAGAFAGVSGVRDVDVQNGKDGAKLLVELAPEADLAQVYNQVERIAREHLGERAFALELRDDRTPALKADFERLNFALQEGIATGHFEQMRSDIARIAAGLGLDDYRLAVDARFVYLALHDDGHALYAVLPRAADGASPLGKPN